MYIIFVPPLLYNKSALAHRALSSFTKHKGGTCTVTQ
nr:MAG TPA: hypothetical protein [Caudoviricetes sp.]